MTGPELHAGDLRRLWAVLRSDLDAAARIVRVIGDAVRPGSRSPALLEQAGVALHLHHFYTACEAALLRIARTVDRVDYSGADWHRDLLASMSRDMPGRRDAVLGADTVRRLDPYRGFRHVVRHVYEFGLDWERVEPLGRKLPEAWAAFSADMERFLDRLLERVAEIDPPVDSGSRD